MSLKKKIEKICKENGWKVASVEYSQGNGKYYYKIELEKDRKVGDEK